VAGPKIGRFQPIYYWLLVCHVSFLSSVAAAGIYEMASNKNRRIFGWWMQIVFAFAYWGIPSNVERNEFPPINALDINPCFPFARALQLPHFAHSGSFPESLLLDKICARQKLGLTVRAVKASFRQWERQRTETGLL